MSSCAWIASAGYSIGAEVPVSPPDTLEKVRPLCDELVCLHTPWDFRAVGQFYADFNQVSDEEVIEILKQSPRC